VVGEEGCLQSVVAVRRWVGEDVSDGPGGLLGEDGGNQFEARTLRCDLPQGELRLGNPEPGHRGCDPEVGQLEEFRLGGRSSASSGGLLTSRGGGRLLIFVVTHFDWRGHQMLRTM